MQTPGDSDADTEARMSTNSPEPTAASGGPESAARFDPAQHLTAAGAPATEDRVYLELACSCGAVRKQYDPPAYLADTVKAWGEQHGGPGHGPVSIADAVVEREARREAAHRAAGRGEEYQPVDIGAYSTEVTAWPDLTTAGQTTQEG